MLEDGNQDCAFATEFQIIMEDQNGDPLLLGTQFTHSYVNYSDAVAVTMGDPFSGVAVSFSRELHYAYEGNIHVATFGLLLLEDLDNLSFKVQANPNASQHTLPVIASCDEVHSVIPVTGRAAALNYSN
jgi:hypothetical protein